MTQTQLLRRYIALAERQGSSARTARGILRAVREGRVRLLLERRWPDRSVLEAEVRRQTDERVRGRALAAALAARYGGVDRILYGGILLAGVPAERAECVLRDVLSWCRLRLGLQGQHPVVLVAGDKLRAAGEWHYFRWRGRWRTAPGSYQRSTRRAEIGVDYLRRLVRRGLVRHRGPGGGIYVAEPEYQRFGWSVHRGATRGGRTLIVVGPNRYVYYARPDRTPVEAIRLAVRAYRAQRRCETEQAELSALAA